MMAANWITYRAAVDMFADAAGAQNVAYRNRPYVAALLDHAATGGIATTAARWDMQTERDVASLLTDEPAALHFRKLFLDELCAQEKCTGTIGQIHHADPITGTFELRFFIGPYGNEKLDTTMRAVGLKFDGEAIAALTGTVGLPTPKPADVYLSPFMRMMLAAIEDFGITSEPDRTLKKDVLVDHFRRQVLPDGTYPSDNLAKAMATLVRPLEAMQGGQKR